MTAQERIGIIKAITLQKYPAMEKASNFDTLALYEYLDGERERVNGILHELVGALNEGSFDTQNCNYLHQMIDEKLTDLSES